MGMLLNPVVGVGVGDEVDGGANGDDGGGVDDDVDKL